MAMPLLPAPEDAGEHNSENVGPSAGRGRTRGKRGPRRSRKASKILDADACLSALSALPGLVAMDMICPAQANALSRIYSTILQHHDRTNAARGQRVALEGDLMDYLRANPQLVNLLEPLLTDEQMDLLMGDINDGTDAEA